MEEEMKDKCEIVLNLICHERCDFNQTMISVFPEDCPLEKILNSFSAECRESNGSLYGYQF